MQEQEQEQFYLVRARGQPRTGSTGERVVHSTCSRKRFRRTDFAGLRVPYYLSLNQTEKKKKEVDVKFLYNYYEQDGNNSPVTGGVGTEELQLHGPSIVVNVAMDSATTFHFDGGVDVYSSASPDNIDFNV